jgi:hypothetical protein
MNDIKNKIRLKLTEKEYGYLFPLVVDNPAECYAEYFFETGDLAFIHSKGAVSIAKFYKELAKGHEGLARVEAGECPAYDELSPLHKEYVQSAFNLRVSLDEETFYAHEACGSNKYWDSFTVL